MTTPGDPAGTDPLLGLLVLADFALGVALNGTIAAVVPTYTDPDGPGRIAGPKSRGSR